MMQAPDLRHLNNVSTIGRLHWPWDRTVVAKRSVWPCSMAEPRRVTVGTAKKSIAAMLPAWFWRKVFHLYGGLPLDLGRYFRRVAVEAISPTLASSSRMRGLPQVGLALHIPRMSWISSWSFPGRPNRCLDFHRQKILNPARCQPMRVSGWRRIRGFLQLGQSRMSRSQKHRSDQRSLGLHFCRLSSMSSWRSARASRARLCRRRKNESGYVRTIQRVTGIAAHIDRNICANRSFLGPMDFLATTEAILPANFGKKASPCGSMTSWSPPAILAPEKSDT